MDTIHQIFNWFLEKADWFFSGLLGMTFQWPPTTGDLITYITALVGLWVWSKNIRRAVKVAGSRIAYLTGFSFSIGMLIARIQTNTKLIKRATYLINHREGIATLVGAEIFIALSQLTFDASLLILGFVLPSPFAAAFIFLALGMVVAHGIKYSQKAMAFQLAAGNIEWLLDDWERLGKQVDKVLAAYEAKNPSPGSEFRAFAKVHKDMSVARKAFYVALGFKNIEGESNTLGEVRQLGLSEVVSEDNIPASQRPE